MQLCENGERTRTAAYDRRDMPASTFEFVAKSRGRIPTSPYGDGSFFEICLMVVAIVKVKASGDETRCVSDLLV